MNTLNQLIRDKAVEIGFTHCGIAKAGILEKEATYLSGWLANNYHGSKDYLKKNYQQLINPAEILKDVKSVVVVLLNYFPSEQMPADAPYRISKYACGKEDYHKVIKKRLATLKKFIISQNENAKARAFVDSGRVLEKTWACRAGLGWQGKHSLLIYPKEGSFFFIGVILTNLELEYDTPFTQNLCGNCRKCMDACPTGAIIAPYQLDIRKCVSYNTIESTEEVPEFFKGKYEKWIYGCETCQDACPWNHFAIPSKDPAFQPNKDILRMDADEWENLDEQTFDRLFENSPVKRIKFPALKRNICFLEKN